MSFYVILAAVVLLLLTWLYVGKARKGDGCKPIPGPKISFMEQASMMRASTKIYMLFYDFAMKYGKIFHVNLFGTKVVILNDLELIRKSFGSNEYGDMFLHRPKTFVGEHILVNGSDLALAEDYNQQTILFRRMVHTCLQKFSQGQKPFESLTAKEITNLLENIESYNGQDLDMTKLVQMSLANTLYILLYGKKPQNNESDMIWDLSNNITALTETSVNLILLYFPLARFLPGFLGDTFRRTENARNQIFVQYNGGLSDEVGLYKSLADFQKETNSKYGYEVISDGNVQSILLDVISGGAKSSLTYITGGILVFLNNRECMRKIHNEIDRVIGQDRKPSLADKSEMHYTMACLYELLRFISVGPLGLPSRITRDTVFEGHYLSKDTLVYKNLWYVHHDPALWQEPWKFDPERFLDENRKLQPPSAPCRRNIIPFSIGKRSCPGADFVVGRAFLYLTSILQKFDILPPSKDQVLDSDPRSYDPGLFLSSPRYHCRAVQRKSETEV